ncbi:MASE1 domain-containing protein [Mycolicibacterium palauense]|uniref:MASE1 domain-containing protein n=1 Tax=Mycolicibacterium palauense TaxID=2034511 RepID=UPI001FE3E734|nr:MASE1 domain-containing protein [Mycolicibacterium palauense]
MSPVPPATAPTRVRSRAGHIAFIGGSLLAVLTIGWFSLVTQPAALTTSAWWPAAGVALGLGLRYPRRYVWPLATAVAVITIVIAVWAGRGAPLSALLSLSTAIEMIIGTVILRGRRDVLPSLAAPRDIVRLLLAIAVASVVYALLSSGAALAVGDPAGAWTRLVTAAPKHGAGMILLAPLFMHLPRRPRQAGTVETLLQITASLAVAVFVFVINGRLPLAFLPFVPLVWAATRLSTRLLLVQMLAIAVIASYGSAYGGGPFAFPRLNPETGSIVLQIFELSMVIVFLALSLSMGHERDTAQRLHDSQDLFRKIFDNSVAGKLIIRRQDDGWYVLRSNPSAAAILPELNEGKVRLRDLLGERAAQAVCTEANDLTDTNALVTVTTGRGRILYISITLISRPGQDRVLALQFHDITEAARARRLEQEELERAAEMARALLPWEIPHAPGWSAAALSVPASQVGGDF